VSSRRLLTGLPLKHDGAVFFGDLFEYLSIFHFRLKRKHPFEKKISFIPSLKISLRERNRKET